MTDDLISRQAAIDAAIRESQVDVAYGWVYGYIDTKDIVDILNDLSSAHRWIPCKERTPKIDMSYPHHEDYLVQYDSGDMDVASWSNVNRFWTDHVTEPYWNCVQFAKVVAWMPLPEPYKE